MEHGRDASQKAELRERIIMTATEAFTLKGIKCITMDDIAAALGISKRTLYEVFADKESLLKECILHKQAERDKYLQAIYEQSNNVLEVILAVFQLSFQFCNLSFVFFHLLGDEFDIRSNLLLGTG